MMKVESEFFSLRKVIVHEPDMGIGYITPEVAEQLLYDDIVFLPRMAEEHFTFTQALKFIIGEQNVIEIEDLLTAILELEAVKMETLSQLKDFEHLDNDTYSALQLMTAQELSSVLISGLDKSFKSLLKPLPNIVFTRDLGCVVKNSIILSKMKKTARTRESLLFKWIVQYHPLFTDFYDRIIDLMDIADPQYQISIEGGDMMLIHPDYLLIGISERTSWQGFELVKSALLKDEIVKNVVAVQLPAERYCMHLDTVFTVISEEVCVGFAPLVFEPNDALKVIKYTVNHAEKSYSSLKDLLLEIYPQMQFIPCGNGTSPFDAREQWTDGANLVAIGRNIAVSYERNVHTLNAFKQIGFSIIDARHILQFSEEGRKSLMNQACIITIPSAELSRARGGSHCMTLPIERG